MKTFHFLLAALGLALCGACANEITSAPSRIELVYVNPEKFTDVKDSVADAGRGRDEYLSILKEHIEKQANKYIPDGQHLALRITDVKMAGDFEPQRGPSFDDIRIIKDIYPPRINLEFKLTDVNGKTLKEGARKIMDMDFLLTINPYFSDDPLRYEKKLIDNWLGSEFGEAKN